jgi:transcriptional regulator GlxA family with amidase domain
MRRVVIVAFPDAQSLDVVGPMEVFATAERLHGGRYETELVSSSPAAVRMNSGLRVVPDRATSACKGAIDTLIVAGGLGVNQAMKDHALVAWIARAAGRSRRVASVCTGAFLLAEAGLLDGRRATTHWASCAHLQHTYPEIEVDKDPIYVKDGHVYTSAGVTSGIDLALALVEEDHGPDASLEVARWLVLFLRRPGGQSQFSAQLAAGAPRREPLLDLQGFIAENLDADLSVPALAERSFMSPRNFARVFRKEFGMTPAVYVEAVRVERARQELESSDAAVDDIARRCGFGTVETMRRAFRRTLGVSPSDYRGRFAWR